MLQLSCIVIHDVYLCNACMLGQSCRPSSMKRSILPGMICPRFFSCLPSAANSALHHSLSNHFISQCAFDPYSSGRYLLNHCTAFVILVDNVVQFSTTHLTNCFIQFFVWKNRWFHRSDVHWDLFSKRLPPPSITEITPIRPPLCWYAPKCCASVFNKAKRHRDFSPIVAVADMPPKALSLVLLSLLLPPSAITLADGHLPTQRIERFSTKPVSAFTNYCCNVTLTNTPVKPEGNTVSFLSCLSHTFFAKQLIAFSISPLTQPMLLASITPAPDFSRNSLTSLAVLRHFDSIFFKIGEPGWARPPR